VYDEDKEKDISVTAGTTDDEDETSDLTLDTCLELFTATEKLGPDDPWYCSQCKEFRQATKKFDLWKAPPILVIHLKRFSYRHKFWREKLETFVSYPVRGLDLSRHLILQPEIPPIYDLYAVSNHYGSMGGGHYTAYSLNRHTNKWYKFDDSYVSEMEEQQAVTSSAYVLFYRRRDTLSLPAVPSMNGDNIEDENSSSSSNNNNNTDNNNNNDHNSNNNGGSSSSHSYHNDDIDDYIIASSPVVIPSTMRSVRHHYMEDDDDPLEESDITSGVTGDAYISADNTDPDVVDVSDSDN